MKRKLLLYLLLAVGVDQATKRLVVHALPQGHSLPIIENYFHLTHLRNPGAAFGILPQQTGFFVVTTILIIAVLIYYWRSWARELKVGSASFGLVIGGACGNLIDRVLNGAVIDWLDFIIWPVFNFADLFIVIGILMLLWSSLFQQKTG